jgi:hypothetical protein
MMLEILLIICNFGNMARLEFMIIRELLNQPIGMVNNMSLTSNL